jgi:hypothetical protein
VYFVPVQVDRASIANIRQEPSSPCEASSTSKERSHCNNG